MTRVTCADGCVLEIRPVPVLGRDDQPYEITLRLLVDGEPFGEVGERCGYFLAATATRLRRARESSGPGAFPQSSLEAGVRAWAQDRGDDPDAAWAVAARYLPRDRELFAHLSRDPDDLTSAGELRVTLRSERRWVDSGWQLRDLAVLEAWGASGRGVRCVLTSEQLQVLLDELVAGCAQVGVVYDSRDDAAGLRRPVG